MNDDRPHRIAFDNLGGDGPTRIELDGRELRGVVGLRIDAGEAGPPEVTIVLRGVVVCGLEPARVVPGPSPAASAVRAAALGQVLCQGCGEWFMPGTGHDCGGLVPRAPTLGG